MKLDSYVRSQVEELNEDSQRYFWETYRRRAKDKSVAFVAWLLLGWHYLYLKNVGVQIAFWLTAGGLFIWWFVDLFRVSSLVDDFNKDIALKTLNEIRG